MPNVGLFEAQGNQRETGLPVDIEAKEFLFPNELMDLVIEVLAKAPGINEWVLTPNDRRSIYWACKDVLE